MMKKININKINFVKLKGGEKIMCFSAVLTTGTFLRGLIKLGSNSYSAGRVGDKPSIALAKKIEKLDAVGLGEIITLLSVGE